MSQDQRQEIGLWVEAESELRPLEGTPSLDAVFEFAARNGITDVYLQVYRGGRAYFRSCRLPDPGFDALDYAIGVSRRTGIRVHAWLNMFNLGVSPNAQALEQLEPLLDNSLRAVGPSPGVEFDTPGHWIDPASGRNRQFLTELIGELSLNYPGLPGVHLDFFRYPYAVPVRPASFVRSGLDVGYGSSRSAFERGGGPSFEQAADGSLQLKDYRLALSWDAFRRSLISGYLTEIRSILADGQLLSVAAVALSERAYLNAYQDWPRWLETGAVDKVLLMSYTGDDELLRRMLLGAAIYAREGGARLIGGIGCYRLRDRSQLEDQREQILRLCDGVCFFSYPALQRLVSTGGGGA